MLITARPLAMVVEVEVMGGLEPHPCSPPSLIIESHDHVEVVTALVDAQIGHFVVLLSVRVAEASDNSRHNPQCPEIAQLTNNAHISSFPPVKCGAAMTGDLRQVRPGALTVSVQLT